MRQILLHIMPGDPGYGSALLGYHYYTWAFIGFAVAIVLIAAMLLFERQFDGDPVQRRTRRVRARGGVAGDRADRAQRDRDAAGMRLCRLPR